MLEHLDDPEGFEPDEEFRAAVLRTGRARRARRRLALTGGTVVATLLLVVGVAAGYTAIRVEQIDRVDLDLGDQPPLTGTFNALLVGTDASAERGPDAGARTDTMLVVRVEPESDRLTVLSLPRDLVVTPLGGGGPTRLNQAFDDGGPQLLVDTVEQRLGIPIDHYAAVDLDGFADLVDAAGGVEIQVPVAVRDASTGLDLAPSACTTIDGDTALALVRSRHIEQLDASGRWVEDASADIGRMARQRRFLEAVLPQLGRGVDGLGGIPTALEVLADHVTIDDTLSTGDLLGWLLADHSDLAVDDLAFPVAPWTTPAQAAVLVPGAGVADVVAAVGGTWPGAAVEPDPAAETVTGPDTFVEGAFLPDSFACDAAAEDPGP